MTDQRNDELEALLAELVERAKMAFAEDLVAVVLFGSAAENRLRATSDVNLLFVLDRFRAERADVFREPLRAAHAALRVETMLLLRDELPVAASLFAVKFSDMAARHRVLYGADPLADLAIGETELRRRLREVLLNLGLRLRERYVLVSLREEQLAPVLAEVAGPLRAAAAAMLRLRGQPARSPREALEIVAASDAAWAQAVALLSLARDAARLPAGAGGPALLGLADLASRLRRQLEEGEAA